jgi:transposase
MYRGDLSEAQWRRLGPLLPRSTTGRPRADDRRFVNGMLWIDRTGAPWRDLPERYGKWSSVSCRFYRWRRAGVWDQILGQLQAQGDAQGRIDWDLHFIDSTIVRAHQHAAGAKGGKAAKPSAAPGVASRPSSTSGRRAAASRSPSP